MRYGKIIAARARIAGAGWTPQQHAAAIDGLIDRVFSGDGEAGRGRSTEGPARTSAVSSHSVSAAGVKVAPAFPGSLPDSPASCNGGAVCDAAAPSRESDDDTRLFVDAYGFADGYESPVWSAAAERAYRERRPGAALRWCAFGVVVLMTIAIGLAWPWL